MEWLRRKKRTQDKWENKVSWVLFGVVKKGEEDPGQMNDDVAK